MLLTKEMKLSEEDEGEGGRGGHTEGLVALSKEERDESEDEREAEADDDAGREECAPPSSPFDLRGPETEDAEEEEDEKGEEKKRRTDTERSELVEGWLSILHQIHIKRSQCTYTRVSLEREAVKEAWRVFSLRSLGPCRVAVEDTSAEFAPLMARVETKAEDPFIQRT